MPLPLWPQVLFLQQAVKGMIQEFQPPLQGQAADSGSPAACVRACALRLRLCLRPAAAALPAWLHGLP